MGSGRRRVAWSDGALRQLDEGISYIAEDSIGSAVRVLELILESAESLTPGLPPMDSRRELRPASPLNQEEVADRLSVAQSNVSRPRSMEPGVTAVSSQSTAIRDGYRI